MSNFKDLHENNTNAKQKMEKKQPSSNITQIGHKILTTIPMETNCRNLVIPRHVT